ncbi:hypothetical protein VTN00DRAFT_1861 [Thermoascus crustaceus]|uniref:uncharacterized protein n=1 Tax=Thermoascus crustaceus TaxID=5088 RepID=UPI00374391DD
MGCFGTKHAFPSLYINSPRRGMILHVALLAGYIVPVGKSLWGPKKPRKLPGFLDKALPLKIQERMVFCVGIPQDRVTRVKSGHMVMTSQPKVVAKFLRKAAG